MKEKPVRIAVQAHPGAKRNEVVRLEDDVWHLKIAAPPTEGKANKELIESARRGFVGWRKRVMPHSCNLSSKPARA